jgi:hypothetical protein
MARADARGDRIWRSIETGEPPALLSARGLFDYARRLCEAREHPERLERVFQLAARVQDRDPASRGFGNLRWTWRDPRVTDGNAVEFCMQDALPMWIEHRRWMPEPAQRRLRELMDFAVQGCLRHRVPSSYTNIAILNAANLIVVGEVSARPEVTAEGAGRLDAYYLWTWEFGTREFCSPTYYGVDVAGLAFIEKYARHEVARRQARQMAELVWTDIAANWFAPAQKLAGAHSRSYDYLAGLGSLDVSLRAVDWLPAAAGGTSPAVDNGYLPAPALRELANRLPRLVRQHWGTTFAESRTHWLTPDITLSSSGAGSGQDDTRLAVDLPGERTAPRCYFIPDGREDPYGKKRYETSTARHLKALHLQPFWCAGQRGPDVLGLVVYRKQDLAAPEVVNIQSHVVLRAAHQGLWVAGRRQTQSWERIRVSSDAAIVLRYGTAGLGIRVPWARRSDDTPAEVSLVDDHNPFGVLRLTVEHRALQKSVEPAAAFWVQAAAGLTSDAAFDAWRRQFETAAASRTATGGAALQFEVPGREGRVAIQAASPFELATTIVPEPSTAVLEIDGRDVGRPLLERLEPARSARSSASPLNPLVLPASGTLGWEAEQGLVFHGMTAAAGPAASGGRFVWQPRAEPEVTRMAGSVVWALRVSRPGRYFLWGRVEAQDTESDSFFEQVSAPGLDWPAKPAWHLHRGKTWNWQPLTLNQSRDPQPLDLPAGVCLIHIRPREAGAKLDRLWITPDAKQRPED